MGILDDVLGWVQAARRSMDSQEDRDGGGDRDQPHSQEEIQCPNCGCRFAPKSGGNRGTLGQPATRRDDDEEPREDGRKLGRVEWAVPPARADKDAMSAPSNPGDKKAEQDQVGKENPSPSAKIHEAISLEERVRAEFDRLQEPTLGKGSVHKTLTFDDPTETSPIDEDQTAPGKSQADAKDLEALVSSALEGLEANPDPEAGAADQGADAASSSPSEADAGGTAAGGAEGSTAGGDADG